MVHIIHSTITDTTTSRWPTKNMQQIINCIKYTKIHNCYSNAASWCVYTKHCYNDGHKLGIKYLNPMKKPESFNIYSNCKVIYLRVKVLKILQDIKLMFIECDNLMCVVFRKILIKYSCVLISLYVYCSARNNQRMRHCFFF